MQNHSVLTTSNPMFTVNNMDEKRNPVIILPGINHSQTFLYDENDCPVLDKNGNAIGGSMLFADTDAAREKLTGLIKKLALVSVIQNSEFVYERAYDVGCAAFSYQKCNMSGDHVNNLKTLRWHSPISKLSEEDKAWVYAMVPMQRLTEIYGEDNFYFFTFNLVGDPMKHAQDLDLYINNVLASTESEKVTLVPISLGGTILAAYLDVYGHEKIDKIVNLVACLDGTPLAADMFIQDFNFDEGFLHHEFLETVFKEIKGSGTTAYLINTALHLLPEEAFNQALSGFVNSLLDTVVLNCPQFWAMVPSTRYDELSLKLISDAAHSVLKQRTDRFQTARLNLKDNLLKAKADGVKVNFISGSNLNFGEKMYSFFGIIKEAKRYNSDGIISLASTTLGATGGANGSKLPDSYIQDAAQAGRTLDYISPDGRIDASTAVIPDNTWIFLDQYHEVGRNDAVINLATALITGEIDDVHSDPEKYPQFNYFCETYILRRRKIPDAEKILKEIDEGTLPCSESRRALVQAALDEGKNVISLTVGDNERAIKACENIDAVIKDLGRAPQPKKESKKEIFIEEFTKVISESSMKHLGGGNIVDKIKSKFRK